MAIKLCGVPGRKLLEGAFPDTPWYKHELETQDFLLINHPVFFAADAHQMDRFLSSKLKFFLRHPRAFWIANQTTGQKVYSPLEVVYHTATPILAWRVSQTLKPVFPGLK